MLSLVFVIVALIMFVLSAIGIGTPRFNLIAAGLAFWVASQLIGRV